MLRAPAWARLIVGGLSALLALWALAGAFASVALVQTPVWTVLGFEIVVLAAGVLGLLFGLGSFQDAPALAITCVAGTVFVASFLADRGSAGSIGSISLALWTPARLALSLILGAVAGLIVLIRNPLSWGFVLRAALLGLLPGVLALMLALSLLGYGQLRPTPSPDTPAANSTLSAPASAVSPPAKSPAWLDSTVRRFNSLPLFVPAKGGGEAIRVVGLTILGIVVIGLTSASVHAAIRAFELGRPDENARRPAAPAAA